MSDKARLAHQGVTLSHSEICDVKPVGVAERQVSAASTTFDDLLCCYVLCVELGVRHYWTRPRSANLLTLCSSKGESGQGGLLVEGLRGVSGVSSSLRPAFNIQRASCALPLWRGQTFDSTWQLKREWIDYFGYWCSGAVVMCW